MSAPKLRIGIDVDGVLADFETAALAMIYDRTDRKYRSFQAALNDPECCDIDDFVYRDHGSDLHDVMLPYLGAKAMLSRLVDHEITVVSASSHISHTRDRWLLHHFGIHRSRVVYAHDKSCWGGDVLIDDYARNLRQWRQHNNGLAILLAQPHNEHVRIEDAARHQAEGIVHARNYDHVLELIAGYRK